jgi:hypothetical protein
MNVEHVIDFTYGEVVFSYFLAALSLAEPQPGEVFWDIGCGTGKPIAIAAMGYPNLSACWGVELLHGLCEAG